MGCGGGAGRAGCDRSGGAFAAGGHRAGRRSRRIAGAGARAALPAGLCRRAAQPLAVAPPLVGFIACFIAVFPSSAHALAEPGLACRENQMPVLQPGRLARVLAAAPGGGSGAAKAVQLLAEGGRLAPEAGEWGVIINFERLGKKGVDL